jgi:hypothetical protein
MTRDIPHLRPGSLVTLTRKPREYPYIDAYDPETKEEVCLSLDSTGVIVGQYQPDLDSYTGSYYNVFVTKMERILIIEFIYIFPLEGNDETW